MISKVIVPAVKRQAGIDALAVMSERIEVEVFESGWLALTQENDCVTIEPAQLTAIIDAARRAGWKL